MIIRVLPNGNTVLEDVDNFKAFAVVCAHLSNLHEPQLSELGHLEDQHFWVDQDWVCRNGRPEDASWLDEFRKMIAMAANAGWINSSGAIRAHVEQRNIER